MAESALLFMGCLALNLVAAWLATERLDLFLPEAMQRTVRTRFLLSGDLSLLSVAEPAPPLPILLEATLAWLPPLRANGLSGILMAAVCGALASALLNRTLACLSVPRRWRYPMVACFALNPITMLHSGAGSSEAVPMLFVLLSIHFLLSWHRTGNLQALISLGFSLGLTSLAFRAGILLAAVALGILCLLEMGSGVDGFGRWIPRRNRPGPLPPPETGYRTGHAPSNDADIISGRTWALLTAACAPVVFLLGGWLLVSLIIPEGPARLIQAASATLQQSPPRQKEAVGPSPSIHGWADEREVARYLDERIGAGRILIDETEGYPIVFFSGRPELFARLGRERLVQGEQDAAGLGYLLVRNPRLDLLSEALSRAPSTSEGATHSQPLLMHEWPAAGWRLYRLR